MEVSGSEYNNNNNNYYYYYYYYYYCHFVSFVSSRLDYCNSLLFGVTDSLVQRLQAVQNAAARLVSGTRRSEHITPVLRQLHWLPVRQRIEFKMAVLVYKALNGFSPQYLADDCQLITTTGRRRL